MFRMSPPVFMLTARFRVPGPTVSPPAPMGSRSGVFTTSGRWTLTSWPRSGTASLQVPSVLHVKLSLNDDSLGTGALANNILEVNFENRGSTFFTGRDGNWDTCPSVLNFIKQYNPGVIGGATGRTRIVMFPPSMEVSARHRNE